MASIKLARPSHSLHRCHWAFQHRHPSSGPGHPSPHYLNHKYIIIYTRKTPLPVQNISTTSITFVGGRILNWTISLPYLPPFVGDFNWQFPLPHPPSLSGIYWVKFPRRWGIFSLYRRRRRLHQRKIFWHFDTQFQKGCLTWYWTSAEIKAKANIKLKEIKT